MRVYRVLYDHRFNEWCVIYQEDLDLVYYVYATITGDSGAAELMSNALNARENSKND